jgi:hypothetical protein
LRQESLGVDIDKAEYEASAKYSKFYISYLTEAHGSGDGDSFWKNIDVDYYRSALFDDSTAVPQLVIDFTEMARLNAENDTHKVTQIFSGESIIKVEIGYWDLVTVEQEDGSLQYEERQQTFFTFIPITFAMN